MKYAISPLLTDKSLVAALEQVQSRPSYSKLMDTVAQYQRSAADIDETYEWQSWSRLESQGGDRLDAIHFVLLTLAWDLRAIRHLIVFDVDQLLEQINSGFQIRSFRQVVLAVRAILERAAITERHLVSMRASFSKIADFPSKRFVEKTLPVPTFNEHFNHRWAAICDARKYIAAQSFNWAAFDDLDKLADVSVGLKKADPKKQFTAGAEVQKLTWTGSHPKDTNLYWWYSLLCDYVHPNFGASALFVDTQQEQHYRFTSGREDTLYVKRLTRRPNDISALTHIIGVIYLPLREALSWTTSQIDWLKAEQRRRYLDLKALEKLCGRDSWKSVRG